MDMMNRIKQLKEEKNAVILAHYYVNADVQEVADFIGDSFYLAKKASETDADKIVFVKVQRYLTLISMYICPMHTLIVLWLIW